LSPLVIFMGQYALQFYVCKFGVFLMLLER
jgi:hypothetical protein